MKNIILNAINKNENNYITYEEFMSLCLYHPEKGYYQKASEKIGRKGDFYTSSSVGKVYGEVIASVFCELVNNQIIEPSFIEIGGGNGRFANAFLCYCEKNELEIYTHIKYVIVDESKHHRQLQTEILEKHHNVQFTSHVSELDQLEKGMIFSNELFDALPVRVVEYQDKKWNEVVLTFDKTNKIIERLIEVGEEVIIDFLKRNHFDGKNGQRVEIPLVMEKVYDSMQAKINQGLIMTVDYGFTREEWELAHRIKGSLRGYYKHEMKTNVLDFLGDMDLTTHIHWDELKQIGEQHKLVNFFFSSQRNALLNFGITNWLVQHAATNPFSEEFKQNRSVQSLITPGGISDAFQVLIQTKGLSESKHSIISQVISKNNFN